MNEKNTKKLNADFPRIFPEQFYFSCGDGWYDLLHKLCSDIDKECERLGLPVEKWVTASQIKEKYGTLRFYVDSYAGSDTVDPFIESAEERSATICEGCGLPGKTREDDWVHTTCDVCETLYKNKWKAQ